MNIRPATVDDILAIVKLENDVFKESLGESFLYDEMMLNPFSHIVIGEVDQKMVGYIGLRVDEEAEIMNFAIFPHEQKKGYGKALLTYALDYLKAHYVKTLSLEVRESNLVAQKLYLSFGFKKSHIRKNYYQNEDAIVFIKEVNP